MNFAQLVTAIGQRSGLVGPNDVIACKNFVGIRYNQLWQAFLWKDSLLEYVVTVDPSVAYAPTASYMPTKNHLILPPIIKNVVAVRSNQDKMNVERPMVYYRVSQDQFNRTGLPMEFMLLSACVWEFDVAQNVNIAIVNGGDIGQSYNIDLLQPDGVTVVRSTLQAPGLIGISDRIDAFNKPVTDGIVSLTVGVSTIVAIPAALTASPKSQRIQFMSKPSTAFTARVLGKRVTPQFSSDNDEPAVSGMDGILYAMATYDMAHRDEFSKVGAAEAQILMNEAVGPSFLQNGVAGGFLKKLIDEEVEQGAFNSRIMPEQGFGGDNWWAGDCGTKAQPYGF